MVPAKALVMIRRMTAMGIAVSVLAFPATGRATAGTPAPCLARTLVLSAFPAEIAPLFSRTTFTGVVVTEDHKKYYLGSLEGKPVALALTGIGLVNAANTVTTALDVLACDGQPSISSIVFSGVSGGRTFIGDVAVPAQWTLDGSTFYPASPSMLDTARRSSKRVRLARSVPAGDPACVGANPNVVHPLTLSHVPEILIGGDGASSDPFGNRAFPCSAGDVFGCAPCKANPSGVGTQTATGVLPFADPGFFTGYFQQKPIPGTYDAQDMETAAVAQIACKHAIPFLAFRALSDGRGDPLQLPGFPFQFFVYRQYAADHAAAAALAFLHDWVGN